MNSWLTKKYTAKYCWLGIFVLMFCLTERSLVKSSNNCSRQFVEHLPHLVFVITSLGADITMRDLVRILVFA